MEKVSIIIPIYNTEKYLKTCIESVLNQSYNQLEVILINDGSTDDSKKICEEYLLKDKRIKLINKANTGVSDTRNVGIKNAVGEYIMFVDSDDYLEKKAIETMVTKIKNNQLLVCGYIENYKNIEINKQIIIKSQEINKKKALEIICDNNQFGGFLWNKIFRKNIIVENNLKFDINIRMCEDLLFVAQYVEKCESIKLISETLYYYRVRKNSAVWNYSSDNRINVYKQIYSLLKNNDISLINFKYVILQYYYKYKEYVNIIEFQNETGLQISEVYRELIFKSNIGLKKKIKLIIEKNFRIIYFYYLKSKAKSKRYFE